MKRKDEEIEILETTEISLNEIKKVANQESTSEPIELLETIKIPVEKIKNLIDIPEEEIELLETIEIPLKEINHSLKKEEPIEILETIKIPIEEIKEQLNNLPSSIKKQQEIEIPIYKIKEIFKKAKRKYLFIGNKKICKKIWIFIFFISLISIIILLYILLNWNNDNLNIENEVKKIQNTVKVEEIVPTPTVTPTPTPTATPTFTPSPSPSATPIEESNPYWDFMYVPYINVNLDNLKKENPDTIGWIKVNNTNINYPFVQTTDNEYYLKHSFYKRKNSAGWVFLDYRNNFETLDKNNILYAHGRLNNTMFGSLKKIVEPSWYQNQDNRYIQISSLYSNTTWEVFSVYTIQPESYYLKTKFTSNSSFQEFYQRLQNRSVYSFNVELNQSDKILTLSSCYNDELRIVLHAKLISINQK